MDKPVCTQQYDVAIIGGGAAGLSAAVFLCRDVQETGGRLSVTVLEKAPRVGKKLLATGNGTCNLTNMRASLARYHGADKTFVKPALTAFPPADACAFFRDIGVECTVRPDGKVYPRPAQASAVLDCLRLEASARGVREQCGCGVTAIRPRGGSFALETTQGTIHAAKVMVCAGGAAAPALGGGNDGYTLLSSLGHTRTPLFPSIVQVRTDTTFVKALKGIRVDGTVAFCLDGRMLAQETGEILFTEYGLSGPAVMQISRCAADWERKKRGRMTAQLDLVPELSLSELDARLIQRVQLPGRMLEDLLTGLVNKRLGQTLLRAADILPLSRPASTLTAAERRRLCGLLKNWSLPVTGTQGMGGAQVTAGGIATAEFDPITMESRLCPGVYAAGEVLDVDGDCGGFNLQWAWASAYTAVQAIIQSRKEKKEGRKTV